MDIWVENAILVAALLVIGFVAYRGATSVIRPLPIPIMAWRISIGCVRTHWKIVLAATVVAGVGAATQEFFVNNPGYNEIVLLGASIFWQAAMATIMAALVVPVHLSIIAIEPKDFVVSGVTFRHRDFRRLVLLAAIYGLVLWLIAYGLRVGLRASVAFAPADFKLLIGYSEWIFDLLVLSFLALVRPALSSGFAHPLQTGVQTAMRYAAPVLLTEGLLLLPPLAFGIIGIQLVRAFLGFNLFVHVLNDVSTVVFSIFQLLAYEASTVIILRSALLKPAPNFWRAEGAEAVYANFRPY